MISIVSTQGILYSNPDVSGLRSVGMSLKTVQLRKAQAFFSFPQCSHPFWDQASNIKPFLVSEIVHNFFGSIPAIQGKEKLVASILAELKRDWHKS